ncbi:hypothetical protein D0Z07_1341 [Hyphodiscus hymeniophilus]|uniref:DUF3074 domain-containing protein n=1 Tax=Hyphodiscus hymeniophilus TaxID=353542 RepID=A0A9P6VQB2_9HELO|nr:hypothetical protein D0Z07_1341 [Hyphodiscus hymeniophilus]
MAALHDALKTLGPAEFSETPLDDLKPFLANAFSNGQLIVDSVPIPAPSDNVVSEGRSRADTTTSIASSASEISISSARTSPPPSDVEALQKEWKPVKLNPRDNPLGMNVYKLGAKDGKGAWFARRSVHEGLGFTKWKKGLEKEFPETMKVQGGPGEGNIRGIGGERRVEFKNVDGVGKLEVYLLSAQFPGPTTPRDFVTMFLTSDQALSDQSGGQTKVPRHFMVISKPCIHPDTAPRDGYIRGQYESVEFIREIPRIQPRKKSSSTTNLPNHTRSRSTTLGKEAVLRNAAQHSSLGSDNGSPDRSGAINTEPQSEGRARGKTISFDESRVSGEGMDLNADDDCETNPVEWIMITRSDPGGSVPRFMVERGTPGGIVSDASKFLNWACAKELEDFDDDAQTLAGDDQDEKAEAQKHTHNHEHDLHNYQTNGHLAGLEEEQSVTGASSETANSETATANSSGYYGMVAGAVGAAGAMIAAHTPHVIIDNLPGHISSRGTPTRRESVSSISSVSSVGSFASARETYELEPTLDSSSLQTTPSQAPNWQDAAKDKELQKLEEKKQKLNEKLKATREKELSKKSEDSAKEEENIRKAEEKHKREVEKAEEKHKREVEKLEQKKQKEAKKVEERRRKAAEKDEKTRLVRELEEMKAEVEVLRKEKQIMIEQVGALQAENTALATKIGRMGLLEVKDEVGRTGRSRASSLKSFTRAASYRSTGSGEKDKESMTPIAPNGS